MGIFSSKNIHKCKKDNECRDYEMCEKKKEGNVCKTITCDSGQEIKDHKCKQIICETGKALKDGVCVLTSMVSNNANAAANAKSGANAALAAGTLPSNINVVPGFQGVHDNHTGKVAGPEECRQLAIKSNGKYVAWGYRNSKQTPEWQNTCFLYPSGFGPYDGNQNDSMHLTGCLQEGDMVKWGCKKEPTSGGVTSVQLCNPWSVVKCKKAGEVMTCDEYNACVKENKRSECGGEEWYLKCK